MTATIADRMRRTADMLEAEAQELRRTADTLDPPLRADLLQERYPDRRRLQEWARQNIRRHLSKQRP